MNDKLTVAQKKVINRLNTAISFDDYSESWHEAGVCGTLDATSITYHNDKYGKYLGMWESEWVGAIIGGFNNNTLEALENKGYIKVLNHKSGTRTSSGSVIRLLK